MARTSTPKAPAPPKALIVTPPPAAGTVTVDAAGALIVMTPSRVSPPAPFAIVTVAALVVKSIALALAAASRAAVPPACAVVSAVIESVSPAPWPAAFTLAAPTIVTAPLAASASIVTPAPGVWSTFTVVVPAPIVILAISAESTLSILTALFVVKTVPPIVTSPRVTVRFETPE